MAACTDRPGLQQPASVRHRLTTLWPPSGVFVFGFAFDRSESGTNSSQGVQGGRIYRSYLGIRLALAETAVKLPPKGPTRASFAWPTPIDAARVSLRGHTVA